jgi:hypothetical protein
MTKTPEGAVGWFTFGVTPKSAVGETREDLGVASGSPTRIVRTFLFTARHFNGVGVISAQQMWHIKPLTHHVLYHERLLRCYNQQRRATLLTSSNRWSVSFFSCICGALSLNSAEVSTISNDAKK